VGGVPSSLFAFIECVHMVVQYDSGLNLCAYEFNEKKVERPDSIIKLYCQIA